MPTLCANIDNLSLFSVRIDDRESCIAAMKIMGTLRKYRSFNNDKLSINLHYVRQYS